MLFWVLQIAGYPLLLWLIWLWFGIAERSVTDLLASVLLGGIIVAGFAILIAAAFEGGLKVRTRLPGALLFVVLVVAGLIAGSFRSNALNWSGLGVVSGVLIPPLLIRKPVLLRNWRYWVGFGVFGAAVCLIPVALLVWIPPAGSLRTQTASMLLRFALAYCGLFAALIVFGKLTRRLASEASGAVA